MKTKKYVVIKIKGESQLLKADVSHHTNEETITINGKLPKAGQLVKVQLQDGSHLIRRWPTDQAFKLSDTDYSDFVGSIISIVGLIQQLILAIAGLIPKKPKKN